MDYNHINGSLPSRVSVHRAGSVSGILVPLSQQNPPALPVVRSVAVPQAMKMRERYLSGSSSTSFADSVNSANGKKQDSTGSVDELSPSATALRPRRTASLASFSVNGPRKSASPEITSISSQKPRKSRKLEFEVERIVDKKVENDLTLYRVKWKGYDDNHDSWEPVENLQNALSSVEEYETLGLEESRLRKVQDSATAGQSIKISADSSSIFVEPPSPEIVPILPILPRVIKSTNGTEALKKKADEKKQTVPVRLSGVIPAVKTPAVMSVQAPTVKLPVAISGQQTPTVKPSVPAPGPQTPRLWSATVDGSPSEEPAARKRKAAEDASSRIKQLSVALEEQLQPRRSQSNGHMAPRMPSGPSPLLRLRVPVPQIQARLPVPPPVPTPRPKSVPVATNGLSGMEKGKMVVNIIAHKPAQLVIRTLEDIEFLVNYADYPQEFVSFHVCSKRANFVLMEYLARHAPLSHVYV